VTLLQELNQRYLGVHTLKEDSFWAHKMGLKAYSPGTFEAAENALRDFASDASMLPRLRERLGDPGLPAEERVGLEGWKKYFEVNTLEKAEAKALSSQLIEMEGRLERSRRAMKLGYFVRGANGTERVDADSVALSLLLATNESEAIRRAAHAGLREIETHVLANGFLDIVRKRNEFGRVLGYEDYYDYKVSRNEGFGKRRLFELLGDLERNTRDACKRSVEGLVREHGALAAEGWNFGFLSSGSISRQLDPYFGFGPALGRWGRSFMNLGIRFRGAELKLDLLSRSGKYENGFMHGPFPTYTDNGRFHPARINFTSLGTPGQIGAGISMLTTLFHEGGHAAHFSNIEMPAPCFSQEFAPTSVAFAETQSMFCDSLVRDPDWRTRYALDAGGRPVPPELLLKGVEIHQRFGALGVRRMLVVCFAEKALYEMSDAELSAADAPEKVLARVREIERDILGLSPSPRPTLSVPHLLSGEGSCSYHGYVLAEMAVQQTRAFFISRDGFLLDNSRIGPDLAAKYWKPGNSRDWLELVRDLTGKPFSAEAIVSELNVDVPEAIQRATRKIQREKDIPFSQAPVELDARISLVHGDEIIVSGHEFAELDRGFSAWIQKL
jgi:Zn-dependent oligopeptidase